MKKIWLENLILWKQLTKKSIQKLGLDFRVVAADSGAIGGSGSKEFHVLADSGEDTIVVCPDCEYGANIEAATRKARNFDYSSSGELQKVETVDKKLLKKLLLFKYSKITNYKSSY